MPVIFGKFGYVGGKIVGFSGCIEHTHWKCTYWCKVIENIDGEWEPMTVSATIVFSTHQRMNTIEYPEDFVDFIRLLWGLK